MIVNTIVQSYDFSIFGSLRKGEPEFMPNSSCAVKLKFSGYGCGLYFSLIFSE